MYSSRMGYLSPSLSPSCVTAASLPATPLRGLGLPNCCFLSEREVDFLNPSTYTGSPATQYWLENQAGQDQKCVSTRQNLSASNLVAIDPNSARTSSRSSDVVGSVTTAAATHPKNASCLNYPYPPALSHFSPCPYRTGSSPNYQTPSYMTTSSSLAEPQDPWFDLEPQGGYPTPKPSSSYCTPPRRESPAVFHTAFAGSAPQTPNFAANLQFEAGENNYTGINFAADSMQDQQRAKSHRAFSWPRDCSNLEESQEKDVLATTQRSDKHLARVRRSYRSRCKKIRDAQGGDHRNVPKARVSCNYGDRCRQTFNRQTDLDRHVNTVRHSAHHFQKSADTL